MKIKNIAMYLPQFHKVKENDEWWGEGFTDWVTVKKAKPLYEEQYQPRIPLYNNYYDLSKKKTMLWQANLTNKYGVDGLCFYHYWFNGKKILEKPAENLLKWTDIDISFCFCWANQTWARTWENIPYTNAWAATVEPKHTEGTSGILLQQDYGDIASWREHFEYVYDFFIDKRYLKIGGKPVFMIYHPDLIPCLGDMVMLWRKMAIEKGLPGIYVIGFNVEDRYEIFDADVEMMATLNYPLRKYHKRDGAVFSDYDEVWQAFLKKEKKEIKTYWCCTVDNDGTPRHGIKGDVYVGANPEKFEKYYKKLIDKSIGQRNEIILINAWNEWGEGAYLEPDERFEYGFLEKIKKLNEEC